MQSVHWKFDVIYDPELESGLVFYTIRPLEYTSTPTNSNVYWKDNDSPQGHGPFKCLQEAGYHHRQIRKLMATEEAKTPCAVIMVDFRNKKRL